MNLHDEPSSVFKSDHFIKKINHDEEEMYWLVEIPFWLSLKNFTIILEQEKFFQKF